MSADDEYEHAVDADDEHDETVDVDPGTGREPEATLLVNVPLARLSAAIQRTMDYVGHTMRALEDFRPSRDLALPAGIVAAFGVHAESHIPGAPIALQVGPSIPLESRGPEATAWVIRKGLSDLITALSGYALQLDRVFAMVDAFGNRKRRIASSTLRAPPILETLSLLIGGLCAEARRVAT